MKKLLVLLVLLGGGYFVTENWPDLMTLFANGMSKLGTGNPFHSISMPAFWGTRDVAGLTLDLPCTLTPYYLQSQSPRAGIHVDCYRGMAGGHKLYLTHATNPEMAGGLMLTYANRPLGAAASNLKLDVISTNSATTMIGGLRARRSDYVSQAIPRIRVRCLLLERANHLWMVECHAPENDAGAEEEFMRIARSVREP